MNKGLEVIEAHHLFSLPIDSVRVLIQRQSRIHSMVEFNDGVVKAQLGISDMALAGTGEAELVYCDDCGFAADVEAATATINLVDGEPGTLEKVSTPGCATISDLAAFLHVPEAGTRKALALVDGDGRPAVCFVPGDHDMKYS